MVGVVWGDAHVAFPETCRYGTKGHVAVCGWPRHVLATKDAGRATTVSKK